MEKLTLRIDRLDTPFIEFLTSKYIVVIEMSVGDIEVKLYESLTELKSV